MQSGIEMGWDAGLRAADSRELWRMWGPSAGQLTGRRLAKEERDVLSSVRLGEKAPSHPPPLVLRPVSHGAGTLKTQTLPCLATGTDAEPLH